MACEVNVLLRSRVPKTGASITTIQLRYWRSIHAELMTHRVFSRNAGSSRAIPVKKMLAQVWSDPAGPIHWGANRAGMQATEELTGWRLWAAKKLWKWTGRAAALGSWAMMKVGLHKQVANRPLEPWQYINVLVTSTEWENFFNLRCHKDAQPEINELACAMRESIRTAPVQDLQPHEWHIPNLLPYEVKALTLDTQLKVSAARAARVSIEPFNGDPSIDKEVARHDLLVGSDPIHASPTEHQAQAADTLGFFANFNGFIQYRSYVESGKSPPVPGAVTCTCNRDGYTGSQLGEDRQVL